MVSHDFHSAFPKKMTIWSVYPIFRPDWGWFVRFLVTRGHGLLFCWAILLFLQPQPTPFFLGGTGWRRWFPVYLLSLSNSQLCLPPGFTNLYIYICNYVNIWDSTSSWWLINLSNFSIKMINLIHFGDWLYIYIYIYHQKLVSFPH